MKTDRDSPTASECRIFTSSPSCHVLFLSFSILLFASLFGLVLYRLILSCLVLHYLVLQYLVLSCLVLSCLVSSCLVSSCLVLSCLAIYSDSTRVHDACCTILLSSIAFHPVFLALHYRYYRDIRIHVRALILPFFSTFPTLSLIFPSIYVFPSFTFWFFLSFRPSLRSLLLLSFHFSSLVNTVRRREWTKKIICCPTVK